MGRRTMIIGTAIFALLLGAYVFLVLPRARVEQRVVSVGVFLILIGLVYRGATELLSRPKPLRLEWRDAGKAEVVSAMPIEDEAIYLWLSMPDEREPRAYVLPWSRDVAQQLQDATNKAEASGDRKSVVTGKRVSVRVDLGGRRGIKKKKKEIKK